MTDGEPRPSCVPGGRLTDRQLRAVLRLLEHELGAQPYPDTTECFDPDCPDCGGARRSRKE